MIVLFKLVTGDEIIGEIVDYHDDKDKMILVNNPLKVVYQQTPRGIQNTVVARFMVFGNPRNVVINANSVVAISEPRDTFIHYYRTALKHYEELDQELDEQLIYASKINEDETSEKAEKIVQDIFTNILNNMPKSKPN